MSDRKGDATPDDEALTNRPDLVRRGKAVDAMTSVDGLRPA